MKGYKALTVAVAAFALPFGGFATAQTASPELLVLPAGSVIELMVLREVDSDRAKPGDPVKLRVNSPVKVRGIVVVPAGTAARGEVTASKKSGLLLQRGKLGVDITSITLGGQEIALKTMLDQHARGGKSDDIVKVLLVPEWLLFARGNSAKLKAGELLSAELAGDACFAAGETGYLPAPCAAPQPAIPSGG